MGTRVCREGRDSKEYDQSIKKVSLKLCEELRTSYKAKPLKGCEIVIRWLISQNYHFCKESLVDIIIMDLNLLCVSMKC